MIRKLTIVLLVMVAQICVATPYYNVRLSKIANAVGVNLPDTIGKNTNNDTLYTFKGKPLRIRTNAFGDVCHIGYKLFHNELMAAYGESPAFDFLERYLLELDLLLDGKTLQQRLDVDNVVITKGNINMLRMVNENCPFSIQYIKRRGYRVTWTVKGKPVTVAFQADCQLIKGCNMIEMDSLLVRDLPKHHSLDNQTILKGWENAKVSTSQDASYKLERKAGNGAYQTIKTWGKGDLDDPEFGDSYTDSNVTPGTTYTYRLTATLMVQDKNKVEQPWTGTAEVKARAASTRPAISVKSSKAKTATVKWAAVKGADGYQVYYGTSKNKMNSAVTKGTKSLSVTKTGLGSKKTYYFRARAYKVVNGKKVYTSWSGVKAVKVK